MTVEAPPIHRWMVRALPFPIDTVIDHGYWSAAYPAQHLSLLMSGLDQLRPRGMWRADMVSACGESLGACYIVTVLDLRGAVHVVARPESTDHRSGVMTAPYLGPVTHEGGVARLPVYPVTNNPRPDGVRRLPIPELSSVPPRSQFDGLTSAYAAIEAVHAENPTVFGLCAP